VTGRWPLLLRLVNKILADYAHLASDVSAQGAILLQQLRTGGPAVVDDLLNNPGHKLDLDKPHERALAVRTTIAASTSLLSPQEAQRFTELGVFAEDETIPFDLVTQLWRATADLNNLRAAQVCKRLAQLALVSDPDAAPDRGITLHDVVRDFLRMELGQQLAKLNGMLIDAIAKDLPPANPLDARNPGPIRVAWWELGDGSRYLWDHIVEHMLDAGRLYEADALAGDLRWVGARLKQFGPAAPAADLFKVNTPRALRLQGALVRTAHLLAPTEPTDAVIDVLHSRVASDPDWGIEVAALRHVYHRLRLVNRWPVPDLPDTALKRVLIGHTETVSAMAVAPDGRWLASSSADGTVRLWNPVTGREGTILKGHKTGVEAVAVAPDGSWLASGGRDGTVRIWDPITREERATLKGHHSGIIARFYDTLGVEAVAVAPDGSWLASGGRDRTVRIWDPMTGQKRATLKKSGSQSHGDRIAAIAVAPDGSWLASGSRNGIVRIWNPLTRQGLATLKGHRRDVEALAVAPDGSWLASGDRDGIVRIWDLVTGRERMALKGHNGGVRAVTVAPDGSWLASGSGDGMVRIWDPVTGKEQAALHGQKSEVEAVAVAPDGSWLASSGGDGMVRIWDPVAAQERPIVNSHSGNVQTVAIAPDGSWLASGGRDGMVRIWDPVTGQESMILRGHNGEVGAVAVAPDGSWLASGGGDWMVRIWDPVTARERMILSGHKGAVSAVAVTADGSWLASGGRDGTVRIWDPLTVGEWMILNGHSGAVSAVAVAADGSWLASGGDDGTVRIWNPMTRTGEKQTLLPETGQERMILKSHNGAVRAVAIAPDGSWLASGGRDGTVRIWNPVTGQERMILKSHNGAVSAVAIAPDGSWLASGGRDGTVRIWDPVTGQKIGLMRVDNTINACASLNVNTLAVGGAAGLYLFEFSN